MKKPSPYALKEVGQALYGERWQRALARDIGVSERTMRYWKAGVGEPDQIQWAAIAKLAEFRGARLRSLAHEIRGIRR